MKEEIKGKFSSVNKGNTLLGIFIILLPLDLPLFWKDLKPEGTEFSVACKVLVNQTFSCSYTLQKLFSKKRSEEMCYNAWSKALEAISSCAQWPSVWSWLIHWNVLSVLYPNKRVLFFLYFCSISLLITTHFSEEFIVLSSCLISTVIPSAERSNRSINAPSSNS